MKKNKKNTAKNLNKGLIAFLVMAVIALNFSLIGNVLADDLEESNQNLALPLPVKNTVNEPTPVTSLLEVTTPAPLAICDHNGDGFRNLSDISEFASCKDTFDANGDGIHDLSDVSLYASMNQDATFCNTTFVCVAKPVVVEQLAICDHNNDGFRNLSDISEFASCKDTFDANSDGIHDVSDVSVYSTMNQNDDFCNKTFVCVASSTPVVVEPIQEVRSNGGSGSKSAGLAICDHNNDGFRNLSDVSEFASCKDTFDANGDGIHDLSDISLYTSMNQDNIFCRDTFKCNPEPKNVSPKVLGEKLSNCKIDSDVAGQTEWADGTLIRTCDMKVYRIENQSKRHIVSLKDLFKYIGQRIYNVTEDVVALF